MLLTNGKNVSRKNIAGKKFLRREDLTESIRISIAVRGFLAKENSEWGMITFLAKEYNVSRTFIYDLILSLTTALSIILYKKPSQVRSISRDMVLQQILSFRMEGKCSLEATSVMMKRLGMPCNSMGFISEYLEKTGSLLPDTLKSDENCSRPGEINDPGSSGWVQSPDNDRQPSPGDHRQGRYSFQR